MGWKTLKLRNVPVVALCTIHKTINIKEKCMSILVKNIIKKFKHSHITI